MTSDSEALTGLWLANHRFFAVPPAPECEVKSHLIFQETTRFLDIYFGEKNPDFMPPIRLCGTPFRLAVWEILKKIPYGKTTSYKAIAEQIACNHPNRRMACQAVGGAVGHNPVSILIPCHRVIGSDGALVGYGGGLDLKKRLLALENGKHQVTGYL
ncbi:MAG: methylated-DNA--[protein]-cysteine S-methyltransferase [Victivallales bacterium]|jgi:methylated-DNA-[protein]-cysteine S-methyltransferase|nr:methylated-DNA--[protein]-cysteine S-methyltransferase [Victivallales bacterium]